MKKKECSICSMIVALVLCKGCKLCDDTEDSGHKVVVKDNVVVTIK